jgi:hypothetical protein
MKGNDILEGLNMKYTFIESLGIEFEDSIIEKIGTFSAKIWGSNSCILSSMKVDQYQGTDFNLLGIPVDVTLNYDGKNYMRRLETTINTGVCTVNFGIRFANGKVKFEKPVLVIGFNFAFINKGNVASLVDLCSESLQEILDTGMDLYLDTVEA